MCVFVCVCVYIYIYYHTHTYIFVCVCVCVCVYDMYIGVGVVVRGEGLQGDQALTDLEEAADMDPTFHLAHDHTGGDRALREP